MRLLRDFVPRNDRRGGQCFKESFFEFLTAISGVNRQLFLFQFFLILWYIKSHIFPFFFLLFIDPNLIIKIFKRFFTFPEFTLNDGFRFLAIARNDRSEGLRVRITKRENGGCCYYIFCF